MFFKTFTECEAYSKFLGLSPNVNKNEIGRQTAPSEILRLDFSEHRDRSLVLSRTVVDWLADYVVAFLWITEYGIWPSSEDLPLYYKLRSTYHDYRPLNEAPGHDFLSHENADLITFLDLALRFGWGGYLFNSPNKLSIFFSHDEWMRVESDESLAAVIADLERLEIPFSIISSRKTLDS